MRYFYTLVLSFLVGIGFAQAPVMPDSTFNGTGRNIFSVGGSLDYGDNIAIQPDGKIIMTGATLSLGGQVKLGVSRMNVDGSFDLSFGTNGISLIPLGSLTYQGGFEPEIVVQPDGKILICGFTQEAGDDDMLVCRLLANGTLDASFGLGGKTWVNFAGPGMPDVANAITTDAAGNVYACGSTRTGSLPTSNDVAIIKLTPNGILDPSFSDDGKLLLDLSGSWDFGYGIAVRTDGKIIVTGYSGLPANFFAIRLLPNGNYDPAFGTAGKVTVDITGNNVADEAWGMTMTPDGKILVVGDAYSQSTSSFVASVVRFTADGVPDPTFSSDGIATFSFSGGDAIMRNAVVQPNGSYLISGNAVINGSIDFAVMALNPDGTLDLTFNSTGKYTLDVSGQNKEDFGYGLALQQDGKILLSGNTQFSEFGNQKYSLLRLKTKEVMAGFSASLSSVCAGQQVQFTNSSLGSNLAFSWFFEGGTPATSTLANPLVTYNTPGSYDVKLIATNTITSDTLLKTDFIQVISIPAIPATPTGSISACSNLVYQYVTAVVPFATSYTWLLTPSNAGTLSGNGNSATFTASTIYTGPYSIKVSATGSCGSSPWSGELNCMLNHNPAVFMIEGNGSFCQGSSGASVTLNGSEIGVSYQLLIENIATGAVVPGTGLPIVWNNLTTEGFYSVVATATFCSQQMAGQVYVGMVTSPVQPDPPTGKNSVCSGATEPYSTFNVPMADTYTWLLNPSNAGVLTANGTQANVAWNPSFTGTATLSVSASNICGTSPQSQALTITVNAIPAPSATGLITVCQNWEADYQTISNPGNTYLWTVTGGNIVSGAGTATVRVSWNATGTGTVMVKETSAQNCEGLSAILNVAVDPCVGLQELSASGQLSAYPNPVQNLLTIKLGESAGKINKLYLIDATGRKVAGFSINGNSEETLDVSNLRSGFYTLQFVNNSLIIKQVKVVKY
ncbi:MAG: T9SS type A sorting domain-containing protein [Bacteroidales bacterium]